MESYSVRLATPFYLKGESFMLKKTMTYTDYNGVQRTEDFYFNLSKAEVTEMEMGTAGGLAEMIKAVVDAKDAPSIIKIFKDLILKAYGEKSPDGKRLIKSEELSTAFSQTEAYSDLFMELATNADEAAKFVNGIIPNAPEQKITAAIPTATSN
jgi:hypothetical protein